MIFVSSSATGLLVAPPPSAVALLINGLAAVADTSTFKVISAPGLFAGIEVSLSQVTTCPDAEQVHTAGSLVADAKVMPSGNVSVTVMVPVVAAPPELLTNSV